ncbi:MAG: tRNA (adenosine(37)-N6)-dimethylallyltransferase, partial [Parvibaculales bacterium]
MSELPILIAGATASGKSALAVALAEKYNGCVINADSMQVYDTLNVLTARPPKEDLRRACHVLYGHVPIAAPYSVGQWLAEALAAIDEAQKNGQRPILVGGTGLYFKSLTQGLADIPD